MPRFGVLRAQRLLGLRHPQPGLGRAEPVHLVYGGWMGTPGPLSWPLCPAGKRKGRPGFGVRRCGSRCRAAAGVSRVLGRRAGGRRAPPGGPAQGGAQGGARLVQSPARGGGRRRLAQVCITRPGPTRRSERTRTPGSGAPGCSYVPSAGARRGPDRRPEHFRCGVGASWAR